MGLWIGLSSPGSIVKAEPMYMRRIARSLSTFKQDRIELASITSFE